MKIRDFIEAFNTMDLRTGARHIDGSSAGDSVSITIDMKGHGPVSDAEIERVTLGSYTLFIYARGDETTDETQQRWLDGKQKEWDELFARARKAEQEQTA